MSPLGLHVSAPDWPVVGNSVPVAVLFMVHIAIAEYSVGAITLAPAMELWGHRHAGDPRALRYARSLGTSYYLVFSLGATFAVFAVVVLIGVWGAAFARLANELLPLFGVAFGIFIVLTPLLVLYKNTFGRMSPGRHAALGFAVCFWQTLFVVCVVGLDTYLITPGHGGLWETTLNAPYWPLLIHRLIGNVSWTALFLAAFAALRLRAAHDDGERAFQAWAARVNLRIGLVTAALMPVDGFALVEVIRHSQPGYFDNLVVGQAAWLMVLQEALLAVVLVGGNIALAAEADRTGGARRAGVVCAAVAFAGMALACMPAFVLRGDAYWARYAGLGVAALVTLVHAVVRSLPRRRAVARDVEVAATRARLGRGVLAAVGITSMALALFMGYIKEQARGGDVVYGEIKQTDAHGVFTPPPGTYP